MSSNKGQKYLFNGIKYKLKQLVFIFLLFPLFTQCNTTTNSREIIRDRNFHNGIKVQGHTINIQLIPSIGYCHSGEVNL